MTEGWEAVPKGSLRRGSVVLAGWLAGLLWVCAGLVAEWIAVWACVKIDGSFPTMVVAGYAAIPCWVMAAYSFWVWARSLEWMNK